MVQICRAAQFYEVLQEPEILCCWALPPTRVLLSSVRSAPGQGHICVLAWGKVKGEFQGQQFLKRVRQSSTHIFHFHSVGDDLIAWPYLAAREAGNGNSTWVPMCPRRKGRMNFEEQLVVSHKHILYARDFQIPQSQQ